MAHPLDNAILLPAGLTEIFQDYLSGKHLTPEEVEKRGTRFLHEFTAARGAPESVGIQLLSPTTINSMTMLIPYLQGDTRDKEKLRSRLAFYEWASDAAALMHTPMAFAELLFERARLQFELDDHTSAGVYGLYAKRVYEQLLGLVPERQREYQQRLGELEGIISCMP